MSNAFSRIGSSTRAPPAAGTGTGGALAWLIVVGALLVLVLVVAPIAGLWGPPASLALGLYTVIAAFVLAGLQHHAPGRFGAANAITLLRAAAVAFLAGITVLDAPLSAAVCGSLGGVGPARPLPRPIARSAGPSGR